VRESRHGGHDADMPSSTTSAIATELDDVRRGYDAPGAPLGSYGLLVTAFNAVGVAALAVRSRRKGLPEGLATRDIALLAVATQKLSRLVARDRVAAPLRAPFTRFQESAGRGEVDEAARGEGLQRALGELLVCPYCVSVWIAGGLTAGFVAAPRPTRLVASLFAGLAGADFLQLAYSAGEKRA
jgi:hypothetical protein